MNPPIPQQINLIKSIFKGRDDVFAVRWEKANKSGYMPAYLYDPYLYRAHKLSGGTFQNYPNKSYLELSDNQIEKHLKGYQQIGIYPLLKDNTSWFIVADFDEADWLSECKRFILVLKDHKISAYLERSRSGKGGHVWVFFDRPYSAFKSRKIILSLLYQSGAISEFDKGASFDRLFPNQDTLSGKGLGNLIALPLYKKSLVNGNSCFLDTETLMPFENQFDFLQTILRISSAHLDALYQINRTVSIKDNQTITPTSLSSSNNVSKLTFTLDNQLVITKYGLTQILITFLKDELNFVNSEFIIKKNSGINTYNTERYFKLIDDVESHLNVPRGFIGKLIRFCRQNKIDFDFIDNRVLLENVKYQFTAQLRDYQMSAIEQISKKDFGVIVAPAGSGKTVLGLQIISQKAQPALIVVHRKQLLDQWINRIETFLGISKSEIGIISAGKVKLGKKVTVATLQSLNNFDSEKHKINLYGSFGTILIDECHHVPAQTFRETITRFKTVYLYGLTATPFRKYNDGRIIFTHLGEVIIEIKPSDIGVNQRLNIAIKETSFDVPYNSKTDSFETLSKILIHDTARNKLILSDVESELSQNKRVVIITERTEHITTLCQFLKHKYEVVSLCGEDSEVNRVLKWKQLNDGNFQVLVTTGQFFGEGADLPNLHTLFLAYPFAFEGKLIQYIGRVQRSEIIPTIYDYRDTKVEYLNQLFLKRNTYYRKVLNITGRNTLQVRKIEKTIKLPFELLDFRYGGFVFTLKIEPFDDIEFMIDNIRIRPELAVLRDYLKKNLKISKCIIAISIEFENGKIISQSAECAQLAAINDELIDSIRFKFVSNNYFGKPKINKTILTFDDFSSSNSISLFESESDLLENILANQEFRHSQNIRFLAQHHDKSLLKIRFVLSPFSFLFLLAGTFQYHILLETLDTEEATYLWHLDKNTKALKSGLLDIENHLALIKSKGRQPFLELNLPNFSRINHDYSDPKRGFTLWKDLLIERIV